MKEQGDQIYRFELGNERLGAADYINGHVKATSTSLC